MSGIMFVVSGPSGVGKSTVLTKVRNQLPDLHFSISATTRSIRPTETHGKDYYFISKEQFNTMIESDQLLEYTEYVHNYYGTPVTPLDDALEQGKDVLLDIEVNGALNARRLRPESVLIFLAPPSLAVLENRLRNRGDTAPADIEKRLERARWEYTHAPKYDYLVINDNVDDAVREIMSIMLAEHCKTKHRMNYLKEDL